MLKPIFWTNLNDVKGEKENVTWDTVCELSKTNQSSNSLYNKSV